MKWRLGPFLWSALTMVLSLALALIVAAREKLVFEASHFASPDYALGPTVGYFFGVVAVMAVVLFFIPQRWLKFVFRALFALIFGGGVFIIAVFYLPQAAVYPLAIAAGISWLFWARVWLHDLLFIGVLAGAGSVLGFSFSPWTFTIFMLVIAVYDVLAVRFGFMIWMADKLSTITTLPAFIFPRQMRDWNLSLKNVRVGDLQQKEATEREYAILGGGDIGFPLMLAVSVFFASGLTSAVMVGAFALMGLMAAFLIQSLWLKGRPMPALPPIAFMSLIGFVLASRILN